MVFPVMAIFPGAFVNNGGGDDAYPVSILNLSLGFMLGDDSLESTILNMLLLFLFTEIGWGSKGMVLMIFRALDSALTVLESDLVFLVLLEVLLLGVDF